MELKQAYIRAFGNREDRIIDFKEGINEIFPIPQREIDLSNGVVTQNPGY
mgnify:CR=1 FL=1